MRSIRLSLMLYFLGLLAVALGVASLLVYQSAQSTLAAKESALRDLIQAQFNEDARKERAKLDERLLARAQFLLGQVRPRWRWPLMRDNHLAGLGMLATHLGPAGPLGSLVNVCQYHVEERRPADERRPRPAPATTEPTSRTTAEERSSPPRSPRGPRWPSLHPVQFQLWHCTLLDLSLGQDVTLPEEGNAPRITYRIETNGWSAPLFPPNGGEVSLPDESDFEPTERIIWRPDNPVLGNGVPVHRVRLRSLITLQETMGPGLGSPRSGTRPTTPGGSDGPPPTPPRPSYRVPPPAIIIQCAADARELDAQIDKLRATRDEALHTVSNKTTEALAQHRNWLFIISSVTFVATVLGSFALVWLGLLPLHRLSDAVSKVSDRDFRLHLGHAPLPQELRPIAERLQATLVQLERAFTREKQATADISHELRTPLAAMLTTIDLALRKPRPVEQYRELFEDCRLSAQQMHQIVERLLTLARLDAGVDRLRPQTVDVADLAEQCATVVRPLAEARGLRLAVSSEAGGPDITPERGAQVRTDPDKLREVLNNLLHNAIQYNRPEGRIDLMVARDNGHVRVEVRDTGIGIAPEARERIFERFYRADPSRNADDLHAGLGLAIVKEYVALMGGRITVESQEGQGSIFRVDLPDLTPAVAG
jgi:heavy metal sensor kinase